VEPTLTRLVTCPAAIPVSHSRDAARPIDSPLDPRALLVPESRRSFMSLDFSACPQLQRAWSRCTRGPRALGNVELERGAAEREGNSHASARWADAAASGCRTAQTIERVRPWAQPTHESCVKCMPSGELRGDCPRTWRAAGRISRETGIRYSPPRGGTSDPQQYASSPSSPLPANFDSSAHHALAGRRLGLPARPSDRSPNNFVDRSTLQAPTSEGMSASGIARLQSPRLGRRA
jgi:hypothetical protein